MAPLGRQDFKALFSELGLNDVKAIGLSSVRESGGNFRNRTFLFAPDGRHGLLAVLGGQPGRFVGARLAPADTDFYSECEFDVSALYDTIKAVVAKVSRSEEHTSELQSLRHLVCRLLLEKKKDKADTPNKLNIHHSEHTLNLLHVWR